MKLALWRHHPVSDQTGRALARRTVAYQHRFQFDLVKVMSPGNWQAVCYGAVDAWKGDRLGRREITLPAIEGPESWAFLPDFPTRPLPAMLEETLTACRLIRRDIPDTPIYATVYSPISQAIQVAGWAAFERHRRMYPETVEAGLRQITRNTLFTLECLRETGVQGVFYVMQHVQELLLPSAQYRHLGTLHDEACLARATDLFADTLVHLHGESVYWPIPRPVPGIRLHVGRHPTNPTPDAFRTNHGLVALPGMSVAELTSVRSVGEAQRRAEALLDLRLADADRLVTCECVLPLNFPDEQIDLWRRAVVPTRAYVTAR